MYNSGLFLLLFVGTSCGQFLAVRKECHPDYELPCENGFCINRMQWCDSSVDCPDGSDENDCDRRNSSSAENIGVPERQYESHFGATTTVASINEGALVRAAEYFMKQRDADYSWGEFTPRAVIAMSFASRVTPIAAKEKELMAKQLNVQLLLDLMQDQSNMTLSKLALYINALYATCQDPRHFQGLDLVARLRLDATEAAHSNSSIPLAFLTLCLSGELTRNDAVKMAELYNLQGYDRVGSKALIMMAMVCYMNRESTNLFVSYAHNFFSAHKIADADVYTKALFMQASLAIKKSVDFQKLLSEQLSDGSFGDMLATYYAIPVLMNSSLLDLKCNSTTNTGMSLDNLLVKRSGNEYHVAYSLWISTENVDEVNSHQLTVTYDGAKSFFEIMLMAAARDPLFQFLYDETSDGKQVYSIAGIPNDSETGKLWMLYSGTINQVTVNSAQNLTLQTVGVDKIFPEDESHYVFWLKRDVSRIKV